MSVMEYVRELWARDGKCTGCGHDPAKHGKHGCEEIVSVTEHDVSWDEPCQCDGPYPVSPEEREP